MANEPHFEVYPEHMTVQPARADHPRLGSVETAAERRPTGEFGWRFRAANGKISAVGGEGFTRIEDAERGVEDFLGELDHVNLVAPPILRVDE